MPTRNSIVFFDGVCGLCNRVVDFFVRMDHQKKLLFAPLQGTTAAQLLDDQLVRSMDSFIFLYQGRLYFKSTAAIKIFLVLGGHWRFIGLAMFLPCWLRDFLYDLIAQNRYSIFGKKDVCRIPTDSEKIRFLP